MAIKDSGERRAFESGAVRDIAEGKGRCDLLPLDVIAQYVSLTDNDDAVLLAISQYIYSGESVYLKLALDKFREAAKWDVFTMLLEVSKHYEEGAKKYAERNWEKGIDLHCYIDSGVRHDLKHMRGDRDEPHNRAFLWNMFGAIWTHNHKPELIDLPFKDKLKTSSDPLFQTPTFRVSECAIDERARKYRETSFA